MMAAFLQLVAQIQRPMVDMSRQIPTFIRVFTSIDRLKELEALPSEESSPSLRMEGHLREYASIISIFHIPEATETFWTISRTTSSPEASPPLWVKPAQEKAPSSG